MAKYLFFLLFFFYSNVFADCIKNNNENIKDILFLDVKIDKSKKFFKKLTKPLIAKVKNQPIDIYKKRHKSIVTIFFKDSSICKYDSKIRVNGDLTDHIEMIDGFPIPSLNINLLNGNILGITKFKLFRPRTRYYSNEIFVTTFLNELNYLSPKTFYIDVSIGNRKVKYIFQESLKKELLERNNLIEGPILESKEDFSNRYLQLSRISNFEWIKENNNKLLSSIKSLKNLNQHLIYSYKFRVSRNEDEILKMYKIDDPIFSEINSFDSIMYALGAQHGLSYDDRRFYYDNINSKLIPIYYDGMSKILSIINYNSYEGIYENFNLERWKKIEPLFLDYHNNYKRSKRDRYANAALTFSAFLGSSNAINQINKIDKSKLLSNLKNNGMNELSMKELNLLLDEIYQRLKFINKYDFKKIKVDDITSQPYLSFYENMNLKDNVKLYFLVEHPNENKIYDLNLVEICDYKLENCNKITLNNENIKNILEQKSFNDDYMIFTAMTKKEYISTKIFLDEKPLLQKYKLVKLDNSLSFYHNHNINFTFNLKSKKLDLIFENNNGRVIFFNSIIDGWNIHADNSENVLIDKFDNIDNLTGCINIVDSKLNNTIFKIKNLNCEDSLNIIRSTGFIKKIHIFDSFSDGLDIDFSSISIDSLEILNSKNDCADFSFGNYFINNSFLHNCGDKAISVGEKSKMIIKNLNVENSYYGVASKDSSHINIKSLDMNKLSICASAYNKKQEFSYASIEIDQFRCKNYKNKVISDKFSKIKINHEL